MKKTSFSTGETESTRHRTAWIEAGPADGPLMIFVHGWPELGIVWRTQLDHFAAAGWRCVAPDMRGYGGSSVPTGTDAYAVREIVTDMVELHDALGGRPAVWVGHDWGSPIVWAIAAHHAERCRAVVNMCVPYLAKGFALPNLVPLVDRALYPVASYPVGQWDYFLFYRENFERAAHDFELDVVATLTRLYRKGSPDSIVKPSRSSGIRANGGWFGPTPHLLPPMQRDEDMLSQTDFDTFVKAFKTTGFHGADAWYMNDDNNLAYAAEAPNGGRLRMPVLFLNAAWDATCYTVQGRLADPMRADCTNLTEVTIEAGHELMLERPDDVNDAMAGWLAAQQLRPLATAQ